MPLQLKRSRGKPPCTRPALSRAFVKSELAIESASLVLEVTIQKLEDALVRRQLVVFFTEAVSFVIEY